MRQSQFDTEDKNGSALANFEIDNSNNAILAQFNPEDLDDDEEKSRSASPTPQQSEGAPSSDHFSQDEISDTTNLLIEAERTKTTVTDEDGGIMSPAPGESIEPKSESKRYARKVGHYTVGKVIGEGTFGKVRLGTHNLTHEKVAIKILEKDRITDLADVERVVREIHILKLIRHPNIIQLYEIIETPK